MKEMWVMKAFHLYGGSVIHVTPSWGMVSSQNLYGELGEI
jgi:hypothetical protein